MIFILLVLALSVPGVIMLVKKKLQQEGDMRGGMSAPVPTQAVYVDPLLRGSNIRRIVVPPQTHAWAMSLGGRQPQENRVFISENRSFEVVDLQRSEDAMSITVLLWDPRLAPEGGELQASVERDSRRIDGQVRAFELIRLPDEIRGELRRSGYSAAPQSIHRAVVDLPAEVTEGSLVLKAITPRSSHSDRIALDTIEF